MINCDGSAVDLSISGCTIRTHSAPVLDSIVSVGLQIPDEPSPVTIETAIVRNASHDRVGLEFLRFQGDERRRRRRVIHGLMKSATAGPVRPRQSST